MPLEPPELLELEPDELALDAELEAELDALEADEPPDEVEVEPPEVEMVTMVPPDELLPPKKPPEKKPPPKPPPPDEPPTMIGTPPLLPTATAGGGGGGGANTGGMMVRVVTVCGAAQATRRTVRRTTRWVVARCTCGRTFDCLTIAGRGGGFSATWTAPPPIIAPPAVQAQSFAKAILTDITVILFLAEQMMKMAEYQYPSAGVAVTSGCKHSV